MLANLGSCATAPPPAAAPPVAVAATNAPLAGSRCDNAVPGVFCRCRGPGDPGEDPAPDPGHKRFELRLSAAGGRIAVESDVLGRFEAKGEQTRCLYFDLLAGSRSRMRVTSVADDPAKGMVPEFAIAEFGPKGPYWYNTLLVQCRGQYGACDQMGAQAWHDTFTGRRRGRLDPCGSAVVKALGWDTSGSESSRDGGFFHDFAVSFDLEIKTFETRFAPGSTECVSQ